MICPSPLCVFLPYNLGKLASSTVPWISVVTGGEKEIQGANPQKHIFFNNGSNPCMVYLPTFTIIYHKDQPNVGK